MSSSSTATAPDMSPRNALFTSTAARTSPTASSKTLMFASILHLRLQQHRRTLSLVLNVQNCSFVKSVLLVKGNDISQVQVDSTTFISNSSFFIHSKTVRVAITNSLFVDNYNKNYNQNDNNVYYAVLGIFGGVEVLIQRCNFTDNIASFAVKLLKSGQCLIADCNFENNWLSVYSTSVETTISRCNFSKHIAKGNLVWASSFGHYVMLIEDSHFFDNVYNVNGAIVSYSQLIVTRSVFRNNTIIESSNVYLNGAAISIYVSLFLKKSKMQSLDRLVNNDILQEATTTITDCLFENNRAAEYGGAISATGSLGLYNLTIQSCEFRNNSARLGGAIYSGIGMKVINSTFSKNVAADGGNIYTSTSNGLSTLSGCTFEDEYVDCALYASRIYCGSGRLVISESLFHNLTPVFFPTDNLRFILYSSIVDSQQKLLIVSVSPMCMHQLTVILWLLELLLRTSL